MWKKVLQSKPGAKKNLSRHGKFITYGCYRTAEILSAAAMIYQLAMLLNFNDLGPVWASLYNSLTQTTEQNIGEMQGKEKRASKY